MKKYIVEEQELKCLLQAAEMVDIISDVLPTGLEPFEEQVTQSEYIDLSDYEQL